ncbi:MAG: T9SS type A sorting domain-containing protein [Candidatus Zixiibacteriota bacterium]
MKTRIFSLIFVLLIFSILIAQDSLEIDCLSRQFGGYAGESIVDGDYLYLCEGARFTIYDISDLPEMTEIGYTYINGNGLSICQDGNYVYTYGWDGNICKIDVSVRESPVEVLHFNYAPVEMSYPIGGYDYREIFVRDSYVYILENFEFNILHLEDDTFEIILDGFGDIDSLSFYSFEFYDGYGFFGTNDGFYVYELFEPSSPLLIDEIGYDSESYYSQIPFDFKIDESQIYVLKSTGSIELYDVSDIFDIELIEHYASFLDTVNYHEIATDFEIIGDFAYTIESGEYRDIDIKMRTIDLSEPHAIPVQTIFETTTWKMFHNIDAHSDFLIYTSLADSLCIFDVSVPEVPEITQKYMNFPGVDNIATDNCQYLYVGKALGGLDVVDLVEPSSPERINTEINEIVIINEIIDDHLLLQLFYREGSGYSYYPDFIYDLSSPTALVIELEDEVPLSEPPSDSEKYYHFADDYLIKDLGFGLFKIYNISDITDVSLFRSYTYDYWDIGSISIFDFRDSYILVRNQSNLNSAKVMDISDTSSFELIDIISYPDSIVNMEFHLDYLFTITKDNGMSIHDISDFSSPILISSLDMPSSRVIDMKIIDDYVYIIEENDGFMIFDISDIEVPYLAASYPCQSPNDMEIQDSIVFVSSSEYGLYILDISEVTESTEEEHRLPQDINLIAYPNPFNGALQISLHAGINIVEVYDITGNLIAKSLPKESENFIWIPEGYIDSGVYLIKATGKENNDVFIEKVIYLK